MLDVDNAGIDPAGRHRIMAPFLKTLRLQMQGSRRSFRIMKNPPGRLLPAQPGGRYLFILFCLNQFRQDNRQKACQSKSVRFFFVVRAEGSRVAAGYLQSLPKKHAVFARTKGFSFLRNSAWACG